MDTFECVLPKTRKIIITSKFNIMTGERNGLYGKNQELVKTKEWIASRINIFQNSTLISLKNQINQDFSAIYVYADHTEEFIFEELGKYPPLPKNIKFVKKSEYMNELQREIVGYDELFLSRLDSDDMYIKNFTEILRNYNLQENTEALLNQYGYIYDSVNGQIADYYHRRFTFYTFIYRLYKEDVLYSSLNVTPWDLLVNFFHGQVVDYNYETIPGRNFIFNINCSNTDSTFGIYDWGEVKVERLIEDENEKQIVLSNFF